LVALTNQGTKQTSNEGTHAQKRSRKSWLQIFAHLGELWSKGQPGRISPAGKNMIFSLDIQREGGKSLGASANRCNKTVIAKPRKPFLIQEKRHF